MAKKTDKEKLKIVRKELQEFKVLYSDARLEAEYWQEVIDVLESRFITSSLINEAQSIVDGRMAL